MNRKIYVKIGKWRNRQLQDNHAYVFLDGLALKKSWGGEVINLSVLIAVGVDHDGYRQALGVSEAANEDKQGWQGFMRK